MTVFNSVERPCETRLNTDIRVDEDIRTTGILRVAGIVDESVVDGPGLRMAIFAQGCERACPGCHNPETWARDGGREITVQDILERARKNPLLRGLTFSGGEPFLQAAAFAELARAARAEGLDIVTFTGYTFEELAASRPRADIGAAAAGDIGGIAGADGVFELLSNTDILIDGPYIAAKRTLSLPFRGSSNQRVLDVQSILSARI